MNTSYSAEKSIQILIALLKHHGIRKIIASPGTTNMMLNASLMYDGGFEMYSSDDERSAAYMACGLSEESKEPVMLTCTGATASRNYMPGLTEAYYRKLPILVVTGTQDIRRMGNLYDQVTDRTVQPKDVVTYSTYIPFVKDKLDERNAELRINQAISALTLNGGGPAHINLETYYTRDLSVKELPKVTPIKRIDVESEFPSLPNGKIAIFIGSHKRFSDIDVSAIDAFCSNHDVVVFCDHCSNYKGKYRQIDALLKLQSAPCLNDIRLLIHFGEISGDHFSMGGNAKEVWRISKDGQLRDRYGKLTYVFDMAETIFFEHYKLENTCESGTFLDECQNDYERLYNNIPELPLSNIWMAKQLHDKLPENSCIHFGVLTSLRSWNFFEISNSINSMCNVGGFGTDGMISSLLGASLCDPDKLYFGVVGDLAFFYDMNALGNRHLGKNIRLMLVNNGKGCEFTHFMNPGHIFKEDVNPYIAAAGHFGNQSPTLVRDYAKNLGMKYLTASTKEEFLANMDEFLNPQISSSYIFEIFTHDYDENEALRLISGYGTSDEVKEALKDNLKKVVGKKGISFIKSVLGQ